MHDYVGLTRQEPADVAGDETAVCVIAAARRRRNNEIDGPAFEKIVVGTRGADQQLRQQEA